MFVALELLEQPEQGFLRRAFNIPPKLRTELVNHRTMGVQIGLIRATVRNGQPDWARVEEIAGPFAGRMLLPDGIEAPQDRTIRQISYPYFEAKMICATASAVIKRTRMQMYRRVIGIIDRYGEHTELLFDLLHNFTSVRVVTQNLQKYELAAEEMMEKLGAPVMVGNSLSMLSDCVLAIAPGEAFGEENGHIPCPVIGGATFDPPQHCELINNLRPTPPPNMEAIPGISPQRLAIALYEHCGVEPYSFIAQHMRFNYREGDLAEMVEIVMQYAKRLMMD